MFSILLKYSFLKILLANCPDANWKIHNMKCYKISSVKATFDGALSGCASESANLVKIESSSENNFLWDMVDEGGTGIIHSDPYAIWINANDRSSGKKNGMF